MVGSGQTFARRKRAGREVARLARVLFMREIHAFVRNCRSSMRLPSINLFTVQEVSTCLKSSTVLTASCRIQFTGAKTFNSRSVHVLL